MLVKHAVVAVDSDTDQGKRGGRALRSRKYMAITSSAYLIKQV
jgi:hypothetical protein